MYIKLLLILSLALLSSCSSFLTKEKELEINFSQPDHIRFSGKGAGASFALMSVMGSAGIAIGIAIDEGVAKEIREKAKSSGLDVNKLIQQLIINAEQFSQFDTFEVKEYGFVIKDGSSDYVAANIEINACFETVCQLKKLTSWHSSTPDEDKVTLDQLKSQTGIIKSLIIEAFK